MGWLLTRGRIPYLAVLAVLTAWFGWHAARLGVERDNESLNTRDPTEAGIYERFRATFGSDEDVLLAVSHPRLLEPDGLLLVDALTRQIAGLDGVRHAYSLTNALELVAGDAGAEPAPLIPPPLDAPDTAARARAAVERNPDYTGLFVSADRRTAGILIEIEDRPGDDRYRSRLIAALRDLVAAHGADGVQLHLTGIAVQKHDVSAYIERDQALLIPLAVLTLGAALAAFFRSLLGVALPLAVTGITVVWTLGAYRLAGFQVNAITALLPPISIVLSLAVSVHIIQGWLDHGTRGSGLGARPSSENQANPEPRAPSPNASASPEPRAPSPEWIARIRAVVRRLRFPCFFATLTTALGFISLVTSDLPAVQQFGVFAALGVVISFAVGMTLVPVGLSFVEPPATPLAGPQHRWLRRLLDGAAALATAHPWRILLGLAALTVVSAAGVVRLRNNTDLVRFLRADAPLFRDTMFIDAHLTGPTMLEFVVRRADGAPLTGHDDVRRMAAFERAILRHEQVTGLTSVLALLRQITRAERGGGALELPADDGATAYAFDLLEAAPEQDLIRKTIAADFTAARFNVRVRAVGTAVTAPLADAILAAGARAFGDGYALDATGAFHQVASGSNRLVDSQVNSFALALALVFIAIGVLFRSFTLVLLCIVPNVTPIIWTGGIMGGLGIDLSTGTTMIASAVLGLIVDDTIHYLTQFYRVFRGDAAAAVRAATTSIGAPLVMNNLILVLGFWVGCFGSFKPTIYFSLLSGVTMITGMLCDLLVTPACLMIVHRQRQPVPVCAPS
jgi:predicted RND superfamily exporter protein